MGKGVPIFDYRHFLVWCRMVCDQEEEEDQRERRNPGERRRQPSDVCSVIREMETCLIMVTLPSSFFTPNNPCVPTSEPYIHSFSFISQPSLAVDPAGYVISYHNMFAILCVVLAPNSYRTWVTSGGA